LTEALIAEAMTVQRFVHFAAVAQAEGSTQVAELLAGFAETAACAAQGHIDILQHLEDPVTHMPLGDTSLNLSAAHEGERYQGMELYPRLVSAAQSEGLPDVASWFRTLAALKTTQAARLSQSLDVLVAIPPAPDAATLDSTDNSNERGLRAINQRDA